MNSRLQRQPWLSIPALLVAAALLGFALGTLNVRLTVAGETPYPSGLLPYTYQNPGSCSMGTEKDPINVVFVNHGYWWEIGNQAENHGGWNYNAGSTQRMGDQFRCREMDSQRASNPDIPPQARFHMRYYNHREANGYDFLDVDDMRSLASAGAHHEDFATCGHAVDDDTEGWTIEGVPVSGGFNLAREDIRKNWVVNSDHIIEDMTLTQFSGHLDCSDMVAQKGVWNGQAVPGRVPPAGGGAGARA